MKKKERPILIVIGNNKNGGIAKRAAMLANGFSDMGRKSTILITKDDSDNSFFDLKENARVVHINDLLTDIKKFESINRKNSLQLETLKIICNFLPKKTNLKKLMGYKVSKKRSTVNLKQALMCFDNPIIIALGLDYAIDVFYATSGIKCDIIYGTRTFAEGELGCHDIDIVRHIINKFSCMVSQTAYTANFFQKKGIRRIEIIGNPLNLDTAPYVGERSKSIVNFCRISKEKRLDLLIRAFSKFHLEFSEYRIDIYGNIVTQIEERHRQELFELIGELGLSDCVSIHSARKDIHDVVKNAAMFISTSDFEGLSNSMIEAMAIGLPCICTDCDGGGAREMIEDSINGLLIPKNNEEALVEAMVKFADDTEFAEKCGRNAISVREKLEVNCIASQWLNVIDKYCS